MQMPFVILLKQSLISNHLVFIISRKNVLFEQTA